MATDRNPWEELGRSNKVIQALTWVLAQPGMHNKRVVMEFADRILRTPNLRRLVESGAELAGPMSVATVVQLSGALMRYAANLPESQDVPSWMG